VGLGEGKLVLILYPLYKYKEWVMARVLIVQSRIAYKITVTYGFPVLCLEGMICPEQLHGSSAFF